MYSHLIENMARALVSAGLISLKDLDKAKDALASQWIDRKAFVWNVNDVHIAANKSGRAISRDTAREILEQVHHAHDAEQGVNWSVLQEHVGDSGRKMTDEEVDAFVATGDPVSE